MVFTAKNQIHVHDQGALIHAALLGRSPGCWDRRDQAGRPDAPEIGCIYSIGAIPNPAHDAFARAAGFIPRGAASGAT